MYTPRFKQLSFVAEFPLSMTFTTNIATRSEGWVPDSYAIQHLLDTSCPNLCRII